jgi:hypothetical protein
MNPLLNDAKPESEIFLNLEHAWKMFCELQGTQETDLAEFKVAIKHAQHVLLLRTTRNALERAKQ